LVSVTSPVPLPLVVGIKEKVKVIVRVQDSAGQNMPAGTTITATTTYGSLLGTTSYTQLDSTRSAAGTDYSFTIEGDTTVSPGELTIVVTTPKGVITPAAFKINEP
jgi:hypothetical protein